MREVRVYTTNKEYSHFIELTKKLHYVRKVIAIDEPSKQETLNNIKQGFKEMSLIKKGKMETTSLNDFLNEI